MHQSMFLDQKAPDQHYTKPYPRLACPLLRKTRIIIVQREFMDLVLWCVLCKEGFGADSGLPWVVSLGEC